MDETSLKSALASGGATVEQGEEPQVLAAATSSITFEEFVPMLQQLQSVQLFLPSAPTFIPQTWQEQIQFVFTGGVYYLYLYFNNQWNSIALAGSSSIEGLSNQISIGSLPSSTPQKLDFVNNVSANGVTWDATNYKFVIETAGVYLLVSSVSWALAPDNGLVYGWIYQNGSPVALSSTTYGNNLNAGTNCSVMVECAIGDYIEAYVEQTTGYYALVDSCSLGVTMA